MSEYDPCSLVLFSARELATLLAAGFEDYVIPMRFDAATVARRIASEAIDAEASQVYFRGGRTVGIILVARRGWTSRIAAMGVNLAVRKGGLGRQMLDDVLKAARVRGDRRMLLEVFAQNEKAVSLYRHAGFSIRRKLLGYSRPPGVATGAPEVEEIDPLELARVAGREGERDLPWQLAAETLSAATHPARAYTLEGHAFALLAPPAAAEESFLLRALVVCRDSRRKGWGSRMVNALAAAFPGLAAEVQPIVPETLAPEFFRVNGFAELPLFQYEMSRDLEP
jgi:GNAT superfamily N-acetyltransferase